MIINKTTILSTYKMPSGRKRVREGSKRGREEAGEHRHGDDTRSTGAVPR